MNITKEQIKKLKPCLDGYRWLIKHGSEGLLKTLLDANKVNPGWAPGLYVRLMNGKQRKQFTIYTAKEVLHIFEEKFPEDDRPRLAIEAAKRVLKSNTKANLRAAWGAADAAYAAAYAVRAVLGACNAANTAANAAIAAAHDAAGAAADADYAAARAARLADYAAYASAAAAGTAVYYATRSAGVTAGIAMQEKLIRKAVKLLEET